MFQRIKDYIKSRKDKKTPKNIDADIEDVVNESMEEIQ